MNKLVSLLYKSNESLFSFYKLQNQKYLSLIRDYILIYKNNKKNNKSLN